MQTGSGAPGNRTPPYPTEIVNPTLISNLEQHEVFEKDLYSVNY